MDVRPLVKDPVSCHRTNNTLANVSAEMGPLCVFLRVLLAQTHLESLETKVSF